MKLRRVLVANRGEIAVRIIRACRDMNIEMVAVYSEADKNSQFAALATRSVCIGPPPAKDSYMNQANILEAAKKTGCDAIHPGYGFLSESADFARLCLDNGLAFIGPDPQAIAAMGEKTTAKRLMAQAGVPTIEGSDGVLASIEEAVQVARKVGYPVMLKAAYGGGGRGMRTANDEDELRRAWPDAARESQSAFSKADLYLEKLIASPRHIEVQVIADKHGNVACLGERECSVQYRNRKLIEEAPAPSLDRDTRNILQGYATKASKAVGYSGAGTVEFVMGGGEIRFIEMNTRLQVEHAVSEAVTGLDIVREQLRVASDLKLGFAQEDVTISGHAIEVRINAEDGDFCPCTGTVGFLHFPGGYGIRVDSAICQGTEITPYYDSLIAKVISWGKTRTQAIYRMRRALEETVITGVKTNIPRLYTLLFNSEFLSGNYDTGILERDTNPLLELAGRM